MKTFKQFQENVAALALPVAGGLALRAALPYAVPAIGAGLKFAQGLMNQATRQPQGATPRTPNVQRGTNQGRVNASNEQIKRDRAAAAAERAAERERQAQAGIDALLGTSEQRREAAQRREENAKRDKQRRTRERMNQAGQRLNLPEQLRGTGGSPYEPYRPQPGPTNPTQPPEGFEEFRKKWGIGKPQPKLANQAPTSYPVGPDGKPLPLDLRTPAEKYLDARRLGNLRKA